MKVLRLIVPSEIGYSLNVLSGVAGVTFADRRVVDIPLDGPEQYEGARRLAHWFRECDGRNQLRNSPSAIDVFAIDVIDLP